MASSSDCLSVLGGTGPLGRGLVLRLAAAGRRVVIGSRDAERARAVASDINRMLQESPRAAAVTGASNAAAALAGDPVLLSVPYAAQAATLTSVGRELAGKVLVVCSVPLSPPHVVVAMRPPAGSAAAEAQAQLGSATRVVAAFQNVAAAKLLDLEASVDCDVLVCGDDDAAKSEALRLAADAGLRSVDAGPLANAAVVDGLTAILIGINRRYGARSAGIRITGVPRLERRGR
jgi:hypothetical protein